MVSRIIGHIRSLPTFAVTHAREYPRRTLAALVAILSLIVLIVMFGMGSIADAPTEGEPTVPQVSVASLGALQSDSKPIVLLGEVRSVSQAELRAQKSGEVTRVNVRAGQTVQAGTILAEIENAGERAAVLQAQGALQAAEAGLARVQAGARAEDRASASAGSQSAEASLAVAKEQARSAYSAAFSAAQDAILAKADTFFANPYTVRPSFRMSSADYDERRALEDERVALGTLLDSWKTEATAETNGASLDRSLADALAHLDQIKRFIDKVAYFVSTQEVNSDRTSSDIATDAALIRGAQQSIDGARSAVAGARSGLAAATSAQTVASLSESKLVVGERTEDVQVARAGVTQARGLLAGATAALENTLIRTPISGTVTSLSVARGDFVSMQQNVAIVANAGAQEIVAYVSEDVRNTITPGMKVLIDGEHEGVITSADPGLDPVTKRSRVTIGTPKQATLTNGAFVEIAITPVQTKDTKTQTGWYIPIAAIKVLPSGLAVFTVDEQGKLVARTISEGTIIGDRMLIQDPLAPDLRIVTDVRGRIEGEKVTVQDTIAQ